MLVSHDLNLAAEPSDRLLLLAEGRVGLLGTPTDVLEERLLEKVYGCRVWVEPSPGTGRPRVQVHWVEVEANPSGRGRTW